MDSIPSTPITRMDEEIAVMQAEINRGIRGISELAGDIQRREYALEAKIKRKARIIAGLQSALKKLNEEKLLLKKKLKNVDLPTANLGIEEMKKLKEEIEELKEKNKKLKKKNKAKGKAIREYKLILDDIACEKYKDDMDEEDGAPSDEEDEGEDFEEIGGVEMGGDVADAAEKVLFEDDNEDESEAEEESDSQDSEYELEKADKVEEEMDKRENEVIKKDIKEQIKKEIENEKAVGKKEAEEAEETDVEMKEEEPEALLTQI